MDSEPADLGRQGGICLLDLCQSAEVSTDGKDVMARFVRERPESRTGLQPNPVRPLAVVLVCFRSETSARPPTNTLAQRILWHGLHGHLWRDNEDTVIISNNFFAAMECNKGLQWPS